MIKPAIAKPLGRLNRPIKENSEPKPQRMRFIIGSHTSKRLNNAMIKPAVPIPLDLFTIIISFLLMVV